MFAISTKGIKETRNTAARKTIYTAVFTQDEIVFRALKNHEAETIGRLNQKFFGRRVETIFSSPLPLSRVFSKNFLRQLPDGTTQASGWSETTRSPTTPKDRNQSSIASITVCSYHSHRKTYEH
jgi:hypothetical protein